jgi:hypothetical protein
MHLGGFPEPYFAGSEVQARPWSREHRNLLVREEIANLERIRDLGNLELLALRPPARFEKPRSIITSIGRCRRKWVRVSRISSPCISSNGSITSRMPRAVTSSCATFAIPPAAKWISSSPSGARSWRWSNASPPTPKSIPACGT